MLSTFNLHHCRIPSSQVPPDSIIDIRIYISVSYFMSRCLKPSCLKNQTVITNLAVIWNNLPRQIRCITELGEFKSQIKRYYIRMLLSDYN